MDKKELKEQQKRENEMRKKFQVGGPSPVSRTLTHVFWPRAHASTRGFRSV
jgi:hypothetical protein